MWTTTMTRIVEIYGPPACDSQHVKFDQRGRRKFEWDMNEDTTITYLYGMVDFEYMFNYDIDDTNNTTFSQYRSTVLEDVHMTTHEININWKLTEDAEELVFSTWMRIDNKLTDCTTMHLTF